MGNPCEQEALTQGGSVERLRRPPAPDMRVCPLLCVLQRFVSYKGFVVDKPHRKHPAHCKCMWPGLCFISTEECVAGGLGASTCAWCATLCCINLCLLDSCNRQSAWIQTAVILPHCDFLVRTWVAGVLHKEQALAGVHGLRCQCECWLAAQVENGKEDGRARRKMQRCRQQAEA